MKNLHYVVGFSLKENFGKSKATIEKAKHLKNASQYFMLYSPEIPERSGLIAKVFLMIKHELKYAIDQFFNRDNKPELIFSRSNFHFGVYVVSKIF